MTNLSVSWIEYTKAYDMVPYTWIFHRLKTFKFANNTRNVIEKPMKSWKVKYASWVETLGEVNMNREIE